MERGVRMVNPHCPMPSPTDAPLPRLSWEDKHALYARAGEPGMREQLSALLKAEDEMHQMRAPGMLRACFKRLRLLVVLDATHNALALREAAHRSIPTISLVAHNCDLAHVTYPVLGREFHPKFTHFFLDWLVKVANVRPANERELGMAHAA